MPLIFLEQDSTPTSKYELQSRTSPCNNKIDHILIFIWLSSSVAILTHLYLVPLSSGLVIVPAAATGQLLAGVICKCGNLRVRQMLRLCVGATVLTIVFITGIMVHCPADQLAGVNVPYDERHTQYDNQQSNQNQTTSIFDHEERR